MLPYNERVEIIAATIDARLDACKLMVRGMQLGHDERTQAEGAALYAKGRELHTYADRFAQRARG